jgi:hypothetical protein
MHVTCGVHGTNIIIISHLFELTFEVNPTVKYNKLKSRDTFQPYIMKQVLDVADLFAALKILNHPAFDF